MAVYTLYREQWIPAPVEQVWNFFSNPQNLAAITPNNMQFRVLTETAGPIYAGQLIRYRVKPLWGIGVSWLTEITHLRPGEFFVDEQRMGPFAFWQHQHHFSAAEGGTKMTDLIHYKNPLGPLGKLANSWMVKQRLNEIFEYRKQKVVELFGSGK